MPNLFEKRPGGYPNRVSEFPNRRKIQNVLGGTTIIADVTRFEGNVSEEGVRWDRDTMEDLEDRIATAIDALEGFYNALQAQVNAIQSTVNNHTTQIGQLQTAVQTAQARADAAYTRASTAITNAATAQARADSAYALANRALLKDVGGTVTGIVTIAPASNGGTPILNIANSYGDRLSFQMDHNQGGHGAIYGSGGQIDFKESDSGPFISLVASSFDVISSEVFKDNIIDATADESAIIYNIDVRRYTLDSDADTVNEGTLYFGAIVEELFKVAPQFVLKDQKGKPQAIRQTSIEFAMLEQLQEHQKYISALQKEVQALQEKLEALNGD